MRVPVLAGPLRGRWWLPHSRGKIFRILTGSYEREQTRLLVSLVSPGDTVFDIGAHTGYYTILASLLVGPDGQVRAFEPDPRNAAFLERHVRMNRCANTVVEAAAVADQDGTSRFGGGSGSGTGRLQEEGSMEVRTLALDPYCESHGLRPTLIKVDVEGAEAQVLRGAERLLRRDRPIVLLSTHGPSAQAESMALMDSLGYEVEAVGGGHLASDNELLCQPRMGGRPTQNTSEGAAG
jgi:FkbM family methyltransferase